MRFCRPENDTKRSHWILPGWMFLVEVIKEKLGDAQSVVVVAGKNQTFACHVLESTACFKMYKCHKI